MRCKDCCHWERKPNKDFGVCETIADQLTSLGVEPAYNKDYEDSTEEENWALDDLIDISRFHVGEHFGCVHFEPEIGGNMLALTGEPQ